MDDREPRTQEELLRDARDAARRAAEEAELEHETERETQQHGWRNFWIALAIIGGILLFCETAFFLKATVECFYAGNLPPSPDGDHLHSFGSGDASNAR